MNEKIKERKSSQVDHLPLNDIEWAMSIALQEAEMARKENEVPVGAIILSPSGKVIARARNQKEKTNNPTAHAEIKVLEIAGKILKDWRLNKHTLVVTLEPCPMCMGAIWQSRISHLVFGAYDPKAGALSLGYSLHKDTRLNHQFTVMGGIQHYQCSQLLSRFFKQRRAGHKFKNKNNF